MLVIITQELKKIGGEMTNEDWDIAMASAKTRRNEFPLFERRACKIMVLINEEEEDDLLMTATEIVDAYLTNIRKDDPEKGKVTLFQKNRLVTYLISRLVELRRVEFGTTPEEDDENSNNTFRAILNSDKGNQETPKESRAESRSDEVPSPSKVKTAPTKRQRSPSPKKGSEHSKEDNVKDDPSYVPNTEPSDNDEETESVALRPKRKTKSKNTASTGNIERLVKRTRRKSDVRLLHRRCRPSL